MSTSVILIRFVTRPPLLAYQKNKMKIHMECTWRVCCCKPNPIL